MYKKGTALPVSFGLILLTTKLQKRVAAKHYNTAQNMDASMQQYLEEIKVTKGFGLTGQNYKDLEKACLDMKRVNMRTETMAGSLVSLSMIILRFGVPIIILAGVSLLTANMIQPVYFLFFLLIATKIYGSLASFHVGRCCIRRSYAFQIEEFKRTAYYGR